jgi:hypothetical protein
VHPPRSFEDLSDDLLTLATLASFYAEGASEFASNSAASRDTQSEIYAIPSISEPGLEITLMAGRSLSLCADIVRGIAHLLTADKTIFSELALIRPCMSAAAKCLYLTESKIETKERLRRWANLAIESAVEEANLFTEGSEERTRREAKIEKLETIAEKIGESIKFRGRATPGLVQARAVGIYENEMKMVKRLITTSPSPTSQTGDVNLLMYRLGSSLIHGQDYGQMIHYMRDGAKASSHESVASVPVGISLPKAALWFTAALLGLLTATESFLIHQGKPLVKLHQEILPIVSGWRTVYLQGR